MSMLSHGKSLRTRRRLLAARIVRARQKMGHDMARQLYWSGKLGPSLPRVLVYCQLGVTAKRYNELFATPVRLA